MEFKAISVDDPNLAAELDRRFAEADGTTTWDEVAAEGCEMREKHTKKDD